MSHISFLRVCSYIKDNKLQDPTNNNILKCDEKLKTILLGRSKATPSELPMIVKLHFPKLPKYIAWRLPIVFPLWCQLPSKTSTFGSHSSRRNRHLPHNIFFRYLAKFYGCGHVFAGEPQGMFIATRITNPFEIFGVLGFS
ncbi:SWIb domain-containing protein [Zea mays]|uniref:SWIb domain-containing protein n=1 Tax=Zea mays TaxID=4577 RepID=A0A1D6EB49_MAIZE|nr:SWIb domain-containing protein [Zea mays]